MARSVIDEVDGVLLSTETKAAALSIGLAALSSRALVWVAAIGGGVAWAFTVAHPEPLRLVASVGYCVSVLLPILWRDTRRE